MTVTFQVIEESGTGPDIVVRVGTVVVQIQDENAILRVVVPIAATPAISSLINPIPDTLTAVGFVSSSHQAAAEFIESNAYVFVLFRSNEL